MIYRILLTGGPHSGKTSAVEALRAHLEAMRVPTVVVPESATQIITSLGSYANVLCQGNVEVFQTNVLNAQKTNELVLEQLVQALHRSTTMTRPTLAPVVMIFDRGVLDGSVFCDSSAQWDAIVKATDTKIGEDIIADGRQSTLRLEGLPSYDLVVHMQSCASRGVQGAYSQYSAQTSTQRLHDRDGAARTDKALYDLYCGHDNFVFVPFQAEFSRKTEILVEHVHHLLHPLTSSLTCSVCRNVSAL